MKHTLVAVALMLSTIPGLGAQNNATRAGEFVVEPSTLICLGFEWDITGDDNRNATVDVEYRATGQTAWKTGLPLLRQGGERINRAPFTVPPRFAGSILDLQPDTEYDVRLTMKDPDGVTGQAVQMTTVRTRAEPKAAEGGRVIHVYPLTWPKNRPKETPNTTGLMAAYNGYVGTGDWNIVALRKAEPGDTFLIHAGLYIGNRRNYVDPYGLTFDGTYLLTAKGTAEKPIVIKAAGDGEVVFDGDGAFRLFDVMGTEHHIFEGITFRNTEVAFWAGVKDVAGAKGLTVRHCRFESVGAGITTEFSGSTGFYIADNVFIGRDDPRRVLGWASPGLYGAHPINSYFAIKVYGSGHTIAHNAAAFFHDGIAISTHGVPDPERKDWAVAIDIYNNDIFVTGDDFIEGDGGVHNIRIMRNRGLNAAHTALSAQPIFGGPAYYIRNVIYNAPVALKFSNPAGVYVLHNTLIAENSTNQQVQNAHFANNLFLGTNRATAVASIGGPTPYSTYDYNGYRPNPGVERNFIWAGARGADAPPPAAAPGGGRGNQQSFRTLAELASATGQETHGIEVDYDIFESLRPPSPPPNSGTYGTPYEAAELNFALRAGSKAVDAGKPIPNVNDGFAGRAPDLGAHEVGQPLPVYGPRGRTGNRPFYW
jgi:hypothetical protein